MGVFISLPIEVDPEAGVRGHTVRLGGAGDACRMGKVRQSWQLPGGSWSPVLLGPLGGGVTHASIDVPKGEG